MRRVTIKEAATLLGVNEEAVKDQITGGQLVACQDTQYKGYVWLKEATEPPPKRKSSSKSQERKTRPASTKSEEEASPSAEATSLATAQKPKSKAADGERRPRTSQRTQEVQLLQEAVAMLREELSAKARQLEQKDAELEARREEVKGLLAVLHHSRALPAPEESEVKVASASATPRKWPVLSLAVNKVLSQAKGIHLYFSRLLSRLKGQPVSDDTAENLAK